MCLKICNSKPTDFDVFQTFQSVDISAVIQDFMFKKFHPFFAVKNYVGTRNHLINTGFISFCTTTFYI